MDRGISRRATDKLSDRAVKSWIAARRNGEDVTGKLADGGGLFITLTPAGTPVWRIKYRFAGKEQVYSVGQYPDVSLEGARAERISVKGQLRAGRDPVAARRVHRADAQSAMSNTFADVMRDWLASDKRRRWSKVHREKSERALERDVLPKLGKLPVGEIRPAMVAQVITTITDRGVTDTAGKILQHVGGIFRFAQAHGLCSSNPADPVREIITTRTGKRRPALLAWRDLGGVLRAAETARLSPAVRLAHRLCAFTAARISNIVQAEWREFDLDSDVPTWTIPRRKMKAQDREHDHKVILGPTITAELKTWRGLTSTKGYVFPSPAGEKHITREAIEKVYRVTLGLEDRHTPHGWRSALSTLARDNGFDRDVVELALDHIHDNEVVRAYDRGERLEQRVKMMRWWDAQLAQAERGADVVPLRAEGAA